MSTSSLPSQNPINIAIEVGDVLLTALQKASSLTTLSNAERFEIAGLTFMAARALCLRKRAAPDGEGNRV
jgi:hypothetical protein